MTHSRFLRKPTDTESQGFRETVGEELDLVFDINAPNTVLVVYVKPTPDGKDWTITFDTAQSL